MLIFTRKIGDGFWIETKDGLIHVYVTDLRRGHARIGIEAPGDMAVYRHELAEKERVAPVIFAEVWRVFKDVQAALAGKKKGLAKGRKVRRRVVRY